MNQKVNPLIFRAYDIRGIAMPVREGDKADLTAETTELIGKGTGTYMKRKYGTKKLIVGKDNRIHSDQLQSAFIKGVLSTGVDVINAGISPSPLIYYAVCKYNLDGGINITASHNPKEYNGVKIVGKNAHSVCGDELQEILKLINAEDFETGDGRLTYHKDTFKDFVEDVKSRIKLAHPLKVVVDAGNGVTGKFAPEILRALGCEVTELYCELDGNFPNHEANPEDAENLKDLSRIVKEKGADCGIGFDGDGDRVGFVDENGKFYSADFLLLILVRDLLAHSPGSQIIFDVKVSRVLIDEIRKLGGQPVMSATGHSFIETKMNELHAPLAGEISGHMFFGKKHYGYYGFDDAMFAACKILEIIASSGKKFSEHFRDLPALATTPEIKAHCPDDKKFQIVKELTDYFTKEHDCVTIDGVRINFDDKSWGAVRCSNTSPNLTLRFEAENQERLQELQKIMYERLKNYPEVDLSWYKPN
jgi:phosphomannomutase/phosphoglucomutase